MTTIHSYVKNLENNWVYSQKAIDLVGKYLKAYYRVFELISSDDTIYISDFNENNNGNGPDYVNDLIEWLKKQPHRKEPKKTINLIHLCKESINEVKTAVEEVVS